MSRPTIEVSPEILETIERVKIRKWNLYMGVGAVYAVILLLIKFLFGLTCMFSTLGVIFLLAVIAAILMAFMQQQIENEEWDNLHQFRNWK